MEVDVMPYKFLEHVSDVLIEATNQSFELALADIAQGMFTQMGDAEQENASFDLEVSAASDEQLVVNTLSEVLAECEIQNITPERIEVSEYAGESIKVTVYGESKQPENIIKAVTYHELEIREDNGIWTIRVLFDV